MEEDRTKLERVKEDARRSLEYERRPHDTVEGGMEGGLKRRMAGQREKGEGGREIRFQHTHQHSTCL